MESQKPSYEDLERLVSELSRENLRLKGGSQDSDDYIDSEYNINSQIERRLELDRLVKDISKGFIDAKNSDIDSMIDDTLRRVGEFADADRSYIFQFHDDRMSNTHEWCADGVTPEKDILQNIPQNILPWWMDKLKKGEHINIRSLSELPPEADEERELLSRQDVKSLLIVPMSYLGSLRGFVGVDYVNRDIKVGDDDSHLFTAISDMVMCSVERKKASNDIERERKRYKNLVESMNDIVFEIEKDGTIRYISPSIKRRSGLRPKDLIGQNMYDSVHPEDVEFVRQQIGNRLVGLEHPIRYRVMNSQGKYIWVKSNGRRVVDENGNKLIRGIMVDIHKEKEAQDRLRESEAKYRHIVQSAPCGIYEVDLKTGKFIDCNEVSHEFMGMTKEQFLSMDPLEMLACENDKKEFVERIFKLVSDENAPTNFSYKVRGKDDVESWINFSMKISNDEHDRPSKAMVVTTDITEVKEIEHKLRGSEQKYKDILANISDFWYCHDFDGNFTELNIASKKGWGYTNNDLEGITLFELIPADDHEGVRTYLSDIVKKGSMTGVYRALTKDGNIKILEYTNRLVYDDDANPSGVQGCATDITEKIEAAKDKKKLEKMLVDSERMKSMGLFAAGVTHDINNVIGGISGYMQLIGMRAENADMDPEFKGYLSDTFGKINQSINKGVGLLGQMKDYSKLGNCEPKMIDPNASVNDALVEVYGKFSRRDSVSSALNATSMVKADPMQIARSISNLVINAYEASESLNDDGLGNVSVISEDIDINHSKEAAYGTILAGRYVRISVSDNGHGIEEDEIMKIIEPFYSKKGRKGTGLGMAIVKGGVTNSRGYLDVKSVMGKGTEFSIYLPALPAFASHGGDGDGR